MKQILFLLLFFITLQVANAADLEIYVQELQAEKAYMDGKLVEAKKWIEEVFAKNPDSPVALFLMGMIIRESEGNSTRALYYYNQAMAFAEHQCGTRPTTTNCVKWHSWIWAEKIYTLTNIDRPQEAYDEILKYDQIYIPRLDAAKIWPLLKLRRHDEARNIAKFVLEYENNKDTRLTAYNGLCCIEADLNHRIETNRVCTEASKQMSSMIIHNNTHIAKFSIFDLAGAEMIAREGASLPNDMYDSIWPMLIYQYTLEERFAEAISAAQEAANIQRNLDGIAHEMTRANHLEGIAQLMMGLGRYEEAYQFAHEVHQLPDRTGNTSVAPEFDQLTNLGFYYVILNAYDHYLNVLQTHATWKDKIKYQFKKFEIVFEKFTIARKLMHIMQNDKLLITLITPYPTYSGVDETMPLWMLSQLQSAVGTAILTSANQTSQKQETELLDKSTPYYQAMEAELAYFTHDDTKFLKLSSLAIANLPAQERIRRSLLKTMLAKVMERQGHATEAMSAYLELLRANPSFMLMLNIALPVNISKNLSGMDAQLQSWILADPRLKKNNQSKITIEVSHQAALHRLCLLDNFNSEIYCKVFDIQEKKYLTTPRLAVREFLDEALGAKVDLSQLDMTTLNGAPTKDNNKAAIQNLMSNP